MDLINQIYEFDLDEEDKDKNKKDCLNPSYKASLCMGKAQEKTAVQNQMIDQLNKRISNNGQNIQSCETPKASLLNNEQTISKETLQNINEQIKNNNNQNSPGIVSSVKRRGNNNSLPLSKQELLITNLTGSNQPNPKNPKLKFKRLSENMLPVERNSDDSLQNTPKQLLKQNIQTIPSPVVVNKIPLINLNNSNGRDEQQEQEELIKEDLSQINGKKQVQKDNLNVHRQRKNSLFYEEQKSNANPFSLQEVSVDLRDKEHSNIPSEDILKQQNQLNTNSVDTKEKSDQKKDEEIQGIRGDQNNNDGTQQNRTKPKQSLFSVFKGIKEATNKFTQILSRKQTFSNSNKQEMLETAKIVRSNTQISNEQDEKNLNKSLNSLQGREQDRQQKMEQYKVNNDQSENFLKAYRSQMRKDYLKKKAHLLFKQHKKLKLSIHYFIYQITCGRFYKTKENLMIMHSRKLLDNDLDIISILNKIKEIEKIKYLLFNQDQLTLFNYFPKPLLHLDENDNIDFKNSQFKKKEKKKNALKIEPGVLNIVNKAKSKFKKVQQKNEQSNQNKKQFSISLNNQKNNLTDFEQLYEAYEHISTLKQKQRFDDVLINMLGDNMKNIFELSYQMGFGIDKLQQLIQKNNCDTPKLQSSLMNQKQQSSDTYQLENVNFEEQSQNKEIDKEQIQKDDLILFQQDSDSSE